MAEKEETRVEKYRNYRESVITDGSKTADDEPFKNVRVSHDTFSSSTTLPISEVMHNVEKKNEEERYRKMKKTRTILYWALGIFGILLLIAIIIIVYMAMFH